MSEKFNLEIISPDQISFNSEVEEVVADLNLDDLGLESKGPWTFAEKGNFGSATLRFFRRLL